LCRRWAMAISDFSITRVRGAREKTFDTIRSAANRCGGFCGAEKHRLFRGFRLFGAPIEAENSIISKKRRGCPSWIHIEPCAALRTLLFDRFCRLCGSCASPPREHDLDGWDVNRSPIASNFEPLVVTRWARSRIDFCGATPLGGRKVGAAWVARCLAHENRAPRGEVLNLGIKIQLKMQP
jgi:hypothetical protein